MHGKRTGVMKNREGNGQQNTNVSTRVSFLCSRKETFVACYINTALEYPDEYVKRIQIESKT